MFRDHTSKSQCLQTVLGNISPDSSLQLALPSEKFLPRYCCFDDTPDPLGVILAAMVSLSIWTISAPEMPCFICHETSK